MPYLRVFHLNWGLGARGGEEGVKRDAYTTCSRSFVAYTAQKSNFPKLISFDIVITYKEHPRYVKHVLGRIYIPYFGCVLLGVDSLRGGLAEGNRTFRIRTVKATRKWLTSNRCHIFRELGGSNFLIQHFGWGIIESSTEILKARRDAIEGCALLFVEHPTDNECIKGGAGYGKKLVGRCL